jgi:hypothetical protein
MRIPLAVLLVASFPAWAADKKVGISVEAGLGLSSTILTCDGRDCPDAPLASLRLAYNFGLFSIGARGAAVFGPEGLDVHGATPYYPHGPAGGYRSSSLLLELGAHTPGTTQATFGLGAGLGHLVRLQCYCNEQYDQHGSGMPIVALAIGVRTFALSPSRTFFLAAEARAEEWLNAETRGAAYGGPSVPSSRLPNTFVSLAGSIGLSL